MASKILANKLISKYFIRPIGRVKLISIVIKYNFDANFFYHFINCSILIFSYFIWFSFWFASRSCRKNKKIKFITPLHLPVHKQYFVFDNLKVYLLYNLLRRCKRLNKQKISKKVNCTKWKTVILINWKECFWKDSNGFMQS